MKKTVLVVDDEPTNRKLFCDLLEAREYTVRVAEDGSEAVASALQERPDLVLMDIGLPVMDGLEATRVLRLNRATCDIPVIALTAYATKGDEEKAMAAGCDAFVSKPVDIAALLELVALHLSRSESEVLVNKE